MSQLVVPIEGAEDVTITIRDRSDRFKSWERRGLYETFDKVEGGLAVKELQLMRTMSAHIIRSWSLPTTPPSVKYQDGVITYSDLDNWDDMDADVEGAVLQLCGPFVKSLQLNFSPSPDKASPTKPSDG